MKWLLLLLTGVLCDFFANAQRPKIDTERFKNEPEYRDSLISLAPRNRRQPWAATIRPSHPLYVEKGKAAGVVTLPLDNMPCIVPDTSELATMPNAFKGKVRVPFVPAPPRIPYVVPPKAQPIADNATPGK